MMQSTNHTTPTSDCHRTFCAAPLETIEIELLLEAVYKRYGYDFRSYARMSIKRRIRQFLADTPYQSISELIPKILYDRTFFSRLARSLSITVTEMFRDPFFYRAVREQVVPILRTWPHIKIWHAGCATGEEVYSLAIILKEEGLFERAIIYATDINDEVLEHARQGIYEARILQQATRHYHLSGGKASFSEYYHARYNAALMNGQFKERIVFSSHNLAADNVFGEMHLIFCRNVLIYFNSALQNRALRLFTKSLAPEGFLCLGLHEDIMFSDVVDRYAVIDSKARIYKKNKMIEKPQFNRPKQGVSCHDEHKQDTRVRV